jgi:hypothetical protein
MVVALAGAAEVQTMERRLFRIEHGPELEELARTSADVLEAALDTYTKRLPAGAELIRVVICDTPGQFQQYAGRMVTPAVVGVAVPEKGIIALKAPDLVPGPTDYVGTLRHELVHVLLARNVKEENLPRWLNEGVAMLLAGEIGWTASMRVARMYVEGRIIEYRDLQLVFLAPGQEMEFGDAYAQAQSMTRFLFDRLGEERFWGVIRSLQRRTFAEALQAELGLTPHEFWSDWVATLWKVALVFGLVSGFTAFQVMALLTVCAYWRKRRQGRRILAAWEEETGGMDEHWDGELPQEDDTVPPWDDDEYDQRH